MSSAQAEVIAVEPRNTRGWPKTRRQLDFAIRVVQYSDSPYAAMKNAGYTDNTAKQESHKLVRKLRPFILFLQEKKNEVAAAHYDVTTDRILREMASIGLQNPRDYVRTVVCNGIVREIGKPLRELTEQQVLAVKSWTTQDIETDHGTEIDYKYVLHDKDNALTQLGRHLGMFNEKLLLDLNMRKSKEKLIDFSAMPQDELGDVIKTLEGIQKKAADARVIDGELDG